MEFKRFSQRIKSKAGDVLAGITEDIPSLRNKARTIVNTLSGRGGEGHFLSLLLIDKQIDLMAAPSLESSASGCDSSVNKILWST
jgi:hypothetical protein